MSVTEANNRDRLVNSCKFFASLFHVGAYAVEDLYTVLQRLGVLNKVTVREAATVAEASQASALEQQAMPMVSMLSGSCPSAQPANGETMADWRTRLACELEFPPDRLGLLAIDSEVPTDAYLADLEGPLQIIVRHVHMKEEYRVEAACTLLSKVIPDLMASAPGADLLKVVFGHWETLEKKIPKRAQFMIMDLKSQVAGHLLATEST